MGRMWFACCADAQYGRMRREVLARDEDVHVARVDSIDEVVNLGRACDVGEFGIIMSCASEEAASMASDIARMLDAVHAREMLVLAYGCDAGDMLRLMRAGATEVIAVDAGRAGNEQPKRLATLGACRENDKDSNAAGQKDSTRDDLVPLEELWPPLDEPEDMDPACGPVAPPGAASSCSVEMPGPSYVDKESCAPDLRELAGQAMARSASRDKGPRAPLITAISGRGGVGKTTVLAALAACAARAGLRAAVLDLDLMSGDMPAVLGAERFRGLEAVVAHEREGILAECDIETSAMRIGPGLTLWGPLEEGERAELFGGSVEQLLEALRGAADVIFADTSCFWGDVVAVAVGACDRCLLVGSAGETSGTSAARAAALASRLGVPSTRMTSVFNRFGGHGCGEDEALRFEMGASLRSRIRIASGGEDVSEMLSFAQLDALVAGDSAFAQSIRTAALGLLSELGCAVDARLIAAQAPDATQSRLKLPWRKKVGAAR